MPRVAEAQERRKQILQAAVAVFSERGYANATVSDVANAAGLAHGTVYLYFQSKADIFSSLVDWFSEKLIAEISAAEPEGTSASLDEDLFRMFDHALVSCAAFPGIASLTLREARAGTREIAPAFQRFERNLSDRLAARLARAIAEGEARDQNVELATSFVLHGLTMAIERLLTNPAGTDAAGLARDTVTLLVHGLARPTERNI